MAGLGKLRRGKAEPSEGRDWAVRDGSVGLGGEQSFTARPKAPLPVSGRGHTVGNTGPLLAEGQDGRKRGIEHRKDCARWRKLWRSCAWKSRASIYALVRICRPQGCGVVDREKAIYRQHSRAFHLFAFCSTVWYGTVDLL